MYDTQSSKEMPGVKNISKNNKRGEIKVETP